MPIVFDPTAKRIVLDTASVTAQEIYSRWCDWIALSDNAKYLPAFRSVGGDDLGAGLSIPPYYFLQNGWRVRPMEAAHNLTITGNLFVEGGGVPVVATLGSFQVNVNYTVPVQAQAVSTNGSSVSAEAVADAVKVALTAELAKLTDLWAVHGLDMNRPLQVSSSQRSAGAMVQNIVTAGQTTTVTRAS